MIETIPEELHGDMLKEFKTGWNFRKVMAEARAQEVGKVNQLEHRSIDGIGRLRMRVDADSYHYWGQRLGYGCWQDKKFLDEYEKTNPYCKVNSKGTKMQFGFISEPSSTRKAKYRKVFA
jgi:hypothetical protein